MKKLIIIISVFIFTLSCKAQQIVPLEKHYEYMNNSDEEYPLGTYFKDINGLLNKYIGTWKGTYSNKNYTFIVTKIKQDYSQISKDILLIRYLITTTSGTVLGDTRSLSDSEPLVIDGNYLSKSKGYYVLNYCGENTTCGQSGDVFISNTIDNKQMKLFLSPDQGFLDAKRCSQVAEQILPTKSMFLIKQ